MAGSARDIVSKLTLVTRRLRSPERSWQIGLADEENFWRNHINGRDDDPDAFLKRLDPERPFPARLVPFLPDRDPVQVLDVGAGPVSVVGTKLEGRTIEVTATDALADKYNAMMDAKGYKPVVRTVQAETEHLDAQFDESSFDIVHAINTLDHHHDALAAVDQMMRVTRHGGVVVLRHNENEAEHARYNGLHQWNFSLDDDGSPLLWNPHRRVRLDEHLAGRAERIEASRTTEPNRPSTIFIAYRKR